MSRADLLIAIGCRFTEVFTAGGTAPIPKRIIQIDIDPSQIGMNYPVEIGITGDARTVLSALIPNVEEPRNTEWRQLVAACASIRTVEARMADRHSSQ